MIVIVGVLAGTILYCALARDWQRVWDPLYDVPTALAVFSFWGGLLAEAMARRFTRAWRVRVGACIIALGIVAASKCNASWHVSGHLTMALLVAVIQWATSLPLWLRLCYWIPVPIVMAMRVFVLHGRIELGLITGLLVGGLLGVVAVRLSRVG
jgi:hypothetical protein